MTDATRPADPRSRHAGGGLPEVQVLADAETAWDAAANEVSRILGEAVLERGLAHWATTGGSAAPEVYRRLAEPPLDESVAWAGIHVWWGDDRFVPYDHPESNVLPLEQILLPSGGDEDQGGTTMADVGGWGGGADIPTANLHRVPAPQAIARGGGAPWAAARYAQDLREVGPPRDASGTPVFDLVWLGMGPDGHVLSVFPGSDVWDEPDLCAAVPAPSHVGPHLERVTMHPRIVAAARTVLLVVTGASKADPLGRAWSGDDARELPARIARTENAIWVLDAAAAAGLDRR